MSEDNNQTIPRDIGPIPRNVRVCLTTPSAEEMSVHSLDLDSREPIDHIGLNVKSSIIDI